MGQVFSGRRSLNAEIQARSMLYRKLIFKLQLRNTTAEQIKRNVDVLNYRLGNYVTSEGETLSFQLLYDDAEEEDFLQKGHVFLSAKIVMDGFVLTHRHVCFTIEEFYVLVANVRDVLFLPAQTALANYKMASSNCDVLKANEPSECCICYDRPDSITLPCGHTFCLICIEQWLQMKKECPSCRDSFCDIQSAWEITELPNKTDLIVQYLEKFLNA